MDPEDTDNLFAIGDETPPDAPASTPADDFLSSVLAEEPETPTAETPPDETPPEETPPATEEEEPELPATASKVTKETFAKLRDSRDRYKKEAAEREAKLKEFESKTKTYETEIETVRSKAALAAELEEKLKDYDELRKFRAAFDFENDPLYVDAVKKPLDTLTLSANALAEANDTDIKAFQDALAEVDLAKQRKMLKEVTADWDDIDRAEALTMAKDARALLDKKDQMRERSLEAQKEFNDIKAGQAEKQKAEARQAYLKEAESVIERVSKAAEFVPVREGETLEDRKSLIAEKVKAVDFSAISPRNQAIMATALFNHEYLVRSHAKLQAELKLLRGRIKEDGETSPRVETTETKPEKPSGDFLAEFGIPSNPFSQSR